MRSRPLRFLVLALGGWICVRAMVLTPAWQSAPDEAGPAPSPLPVARSPMPAATIARAAAAAAPAPASTGASPALQHAGRHTLVRELAAKADTGLTPALALVPSLSTPAAPAGGGPGGPPARPRGAGRRWSAAAWAIVRQESGEATLAPGGTLGGSQAGARVRYRIGRRLALTARAYVALRRPAASEVSAGLDWRPIAAVPAGILAERRQAIGREGRSAFSVTVHGGGGRALPGGLRLEAYVQAGLVGLRSRDAFVDGLARVSAPVGPVEVGAGLWGAAQPAASRLDAGPTLSYRLPIRGARLRVEADWRFRVAGDAAPGSGPALTLAADF